MQLSSATGSAELNRDWSNGYDPIEHSLLDASQIEPYSYTAHNPINRADPTGKAFIDKALLVTISVTSGQRIAEVGYRNAGRISLNLDSIPRAVNLQAALFEARGFFPFLRNTIATGQIGRLQNGSVRVSDVVAVSDSRLVPFIQKAIAGTNQILVNVEEGVHAELQIVRYAIREGYSLRYSIGAGRIICQECAGAIEAAKFQAYGPLTNPWLY